MKVNSIIFAILACFAFVFIYEYFIHGVLLADDYIKTAHLWRKQADSPMHFMFIGQFLFALFAVGIFCLVGGGMAGGISFGLMLGLLLASLDLGKYCYMPVPLKLILCWMVASMGKGLGVGVLSSLICKSRSA